MKILVTGATGFIGHHVVNWLVENRPNDEIIATGTSEEKAKKYSWFDKVSFIPCDYFAEEKNYYEFFKQPDLLIHLAWKGLPNYMMPFHMTENLPVEMRFLSSFIAAEKKPKVAVTGTCYEYGVVNGCIAEDHPTNPNTYYSAAKDALRCYLELSANANAAPWNWIRLFFIYGEGQSPKSLLPQLDAAIARGDAEFPMSGGAQLRDYLPAETVAENICRIALSDVNGVVNNCSGKPISVRELVERRISEAGSSIKPKLGVYGYPVYEGMEFWGDDTKLREVIKDGA